MSREATICRCLFIARLVNLPTNGGAQRFVDVKWLDSTMLRWGITWEDLTEADPDTVLALLANRETWPDPVHRNRWDAACVPDEERMSEGKQLDPNRVMYGIGPVDRECGFAGYDAGPFSSLDEAYKEPGVTGLAIYEIKADGSERILDVYSHGRWAMSNVFAEVGDALATVESRKPPSTMMQDIKDNFYKAYPDDKPGGPASKVAKLNIGATTMAAPKRNFASMAATQPPRTPPPKRPVQQEAAATGVMNNTPSDETPGDSHLTPKPPAKPAKVAKPSQKQPGDQPTFADGDNRESALTETAKIAGRSVFVCVGKTINIGNYETVRIDAGRTELVADGQDPAEVRQAIMDDLVPWVQGVEDEVRSTVG